MSFGVLMYLPSEHIEECKSTEQNVADVPIGETVSKAEVLALINKAMFNTDNKDIQDYIFNGLRRDVHHLPSIYRPKGEWIDKGEYAECSICGAHSGKQFDGVEPIPLKTPYCPSCGADMRGEK